MKTTKLSNKLELEKACNESKNAAEVLEKFNLKPSSGNYTTLKKYMACYKLTISGFGKFRRSKRKKTYNDSECFKENSTIARHHLKKRIIENELIKYECHICKLGETWNNKKLVLQLEHLNGINNDNRLENLKFICPNCHSQTETYAAKNKTYVHVPRLATETPNLSG